MTDGHGQDGMGTSHAYEVAHPTVSHYYGDIVRRVFISAAVALLVVSPFFNDVVPMALPAGIFFAIILASLAAITNPRKQWVMVLDTVAAAIGLLVAQLFAIASFNAGSILGFFGFEAFAIAFLFALYFSVKTVRAMMLHQIGKKNTVVEFLEESEE